MHDSTATRSTFTKIIITMAATLALVFGGTIAAPQAAHADVAGQYTWVCQLSNGSNYTLKQGTALNTCKGSYLQGFINGKRVHNINMTEAGTRATNNFTVGCIVATVGGSLKVLSTGGLSLVIAANSVLAKQKAACRA